MKKSLALLGFALILSLGASSQIMSKNALGVKLGGSTGDFSGFGAEISYQRALNHINRLELNAAFNGGDGYSTFGVNGAYQWVWNIDGGFNWYAAPAASIGFADPKHGDTEFLFGVGGQVGIEYRFTEVPLMLSLDFNPYIGLANSQGFYSSFALGIRCCF